MPDPTTPERRRELLREMTQQAIEAGTYGEPTPERHDPPVEDVCGVERTYDGSHIAHVCRKPGDRCGGVHVCACGLVWETPTPEHPTPPDDTEGLHDHANNLASSHGGEHGGPERQDLRERLIAVIKSVRIRPELDGAVTAMIMAGTGFHITDEEAAPLADAVLAVLVEPPGDLREQMVAAILDMPGKLFTHDTHRKHGDGFAAGCPVCKSDVPAMVDAALSVRWEDAARRIAAAEARAEHAEGELSSLRDHRARWETEHAEVERLRAIITSLDCATAERDVAIRRRDQAENRAALYRQQAADEHQRAEKAEAERDAARLIVEELQALRDSLSSQLDSAAAERDRVTAELDTVVAAVRTAWTTHIRDTHPNRPTVTDCPGCRVLVPLSRDLPRKPDVPEEIRRLAQATTTEETTDE